MMIVIQIMTMIVHVNYEGGGIDVGELLIYTGILMKCGDCVDWKVDMAK